MTKEERDFLERDFEKTYARKLKRLEKRAYFQKRRAELGLKKMQTSKQLVYGIMGFTLLSFLSIMGYAMWVMFQLQDASALDTLITIGVGTPLTLALEYGIYVSKSYMENRESARIELEREKLHSHSTMDE